MLMNPPSRWLVQGATLLAWALAAASVTFWALRLAGTPGASVPVASVPAGPQSEGDGVALARVLGGGVVAAPAAPVASLASRFALVGVVASVGRGGAALIAVDGKPPKPYRVGQRVDEGLWLQSVGARQALLGPEASGTAVVTLDLPATRK